MSKFKIAFGDCLETMSRLPDNSIDAVITDPPYGLGFMGKKWDALPPGKDWAEACYRVMKPGAHLVAFGGTRTWHRLAVAIEDAGFEIRDNIVWLYGTGFPKSVNVGKAIDKAAGAEREVISTRPGRMPQAQAKDWGNPGVDNFRDARRGTVEMPVTAPATDAAKQWDGWGTALKPAFEPIVVARKPFKGSLTDNVLKWGTGAINIDECRIEAEGRLLRELDAKASANGAVYAGRREAGTGFDGGSKAVGSTDLGRWPANVILSHTDECVEVGTRKVGAYGSIKDAGPRENAVYGTDLRNRGDWVPYGNDDGTETITAYECVPGCPVAELDAQSDGASRFFYCSKASPSERPSVVVDGRTISHPTVKPLKLMRYLVRMYCPPKGIILDTFAGTGTTVEAAMLEGIQVIGMENDPDCLLLIDVRTTRATEQISQVNAT